MVHYQIAFSKGYIYFRFLYLFLCYLQHTCISKNLMTTPPTIPARLYLSKPPRYEPVHPCPPSRSRLLYFTLTTRFEICVQKRFNFVSFTVVLLLQNPWECSASCSSVFRMLKQLLVLCLKTKPKWCHFAQSLKIQSGFQIILSLLLQFL